MSNRMKILLVVICIAALAIGASKLNERSNGVSANQADSSPAADGGVSYLVNGGFDKNTDAWRTSAKWPAVWSDAQGNGLVRVAATSEGGGAGRGVLSQCISVAGNLKLEFGGSLKTDQVSTQSGNGRLRVSWHEAQDCTGKGNVIGMSVGAQEVSGWQQIRIRDLLIPENARGVTVSVIQSVEGSGEFVAYWDDLYLKVVE